MKEETQRIIYEVIHKYRLVDVWFVIEKGEWEVGPFKYYLLLFNPNKQIERCYMAHASEYDLVELGSAVVCPDPERLNEQVLRTLLKRQEISDRYKSSLGAVPGHDSIEL